MSRDSSISPELEQEILKLREENAALRRKLRTYRDTDSKLEELRQQNQQLLRQLQRAQEWVERQRSPEGTKTQELRTIHLALEETREQLQETERKAREDDEARSTLVATVSHELRTPINSLLGMVQLILHDPLSTKQRERLKAVQRSAEELLLLLNDMLDISRLEQGLLQTERTYFNPQVLAEETATLMAPNAQQKGLEFLFHYSPSIPSTLVGDPHRLRQVLMNLLDNAIKFTDSGHVLLEVVLAEQRRNQFWLTFRVEDTGIGLSVKDQERIFAPFTQANAATARLFGGSGLGLNISHKLVELMGGELMIHSEEGRGASFFFTIPFGVAAHQQHRSSPPSSPFRILLVEEHEATRKILLTQLVAMGLSAVAVDSFTEALRLMMHHHKEQIPFQAVMFEQHEHSRGWQPFLYAVRLHPHLRHTSVLVMRKPEESPVEEVSADALLMKPILTSQLQETIRRLMIASDSLPLLPGPEISKTGKVETPSTPSRKKSAVYTQPRTVSSSFPAPLVGKKFPIHVLVAEDNAINQKVASGLLTHLGCDVETANNGEEAISMACENEYDLIFMDCRMPRMDGFTATQKLREQLKRYVPIVAMTANVMEGDRERCLDAGMDDYVAKPMSPEALKAVLERWL